MSHCVTIIHRSQRQTVVWTILPDTTVRLQHEGYRTSQTDTNPTTGYSHTGRGRPQRLAAACHWNGPYTAFPFFPFFFSITLVLAYSGSGSNGRAISGAIKKRERERDQAKSAGGTGHRVCRLASAATQHAGSSQNKQIAIIIFLIGMCKQYGRWHDPALDAPIDVMHASIVLCVGTYVHGVAISPRFVLAAFPASPMARGGERCQMRARTSATSCRRRSEHQDKTE
jgi:hypothetical protein